MVDSLYSALVYARSGPNAIQLILSGLPLSGAVFGWLKTTTPGRDPSRLERAMHADAVLRIAVGDFPVALSIPGAVKLNQRQNSWGC
jgi:hypothetical protein